MTKQEQFEIFYQKTLTSVCDNYKQMSNLKLQESKEFYAGYAQGQLLALIRFTILLDIGFETLDQIESLLYKV